jgi:hypothetical protein
MGNEMDGRMINTSQRRRFLCDRQLPGSQPNDAANRWPGAITGSQHVYEVRPRKEKRGVDLISDVLPFGALWYGEADAISNAINYA